MKDDSICHSRIVWCSDHKCISAPHKTRGEWNKDILKRLGLDQIDLPMICRPRTK